MKFIYKIFIISVITLLCDVPFLLYINKYFKEMLYRVQFGNPLKLRYLLIFPIYVLMAILIYISVIDNEKDNKKILLKAFFTGFAAHGLYELTNYSTLINWDLNFIFLDMLWGGILFTIVSFISKFIINKIG